MNCYICGKEDKSMGGLMYHKKNVHGSDVRSKPYDMKMDKKERKKLHCSERYCAAKLEEHYKASHRDRFEFVFCRICDSDCRKEAFESHVRAHNIDDDDVYIKQVELDNLFKSNSYDDVVTSFVKQIKKKDDFHYRSFAYVSRGCRFFDICKSQWRDITFNDHLRDHNKNGDSHNIEPN